MILKLEVHELRILRDVLEYLDINSETLSKIIQQFYLNRGYTIVYSNTEPKVEEMLNFYEYLNLDDIKRFIESNNFETTN